MPSGCKAIRDGSLAQHGHRGLHRSYSQTTAP